ncbi:hypothetical protein ABZ590_19810 [Streptomyces hirsutus]|uniref:hypothetical protein n=1 Tax=Streptomyces hirsutus TaxID=35620 RepID=UPI00340FC64C
MQLQKPAAPESPPADFLADAWSLTPPAPAAELDAAAADTTPAATSPAKPAPVDDQAVDLREAFEKYLPGVASLYTLRTARATDPTFPASDEHDRAPEGAPPHRPRPA